MSEITDREFVRTFTIVMVSIVVIGVIAFVVANNVGEERVSAKMAPEQVAARLAPVGKARLTGEPQVVATATAKPAEARAPMSAKEVVSSVCAGCHDSGVLDAPKTGDQAAWDARLAAVGGMDALVASAAKGKGGMPARGGQADLTDAELYAAVAALAGQASAAAPVAAPAAEVPTAAPAPVASEPVAAAAPAAPAIDGAKIYSASCQGCHASGVMNAPRLGDAATWTARMGKGMDAVMSNVLNGTAAGMPPRGTCFTCSDDDLHAAVKYMAGM